MMSERDFVRQLQKDFPVAAPVEIGIGDDGAVLRGERRQVVVTDMLLDGRHFDTKVDAAALIGRKSVAVNLSDLAAMAARPTAVFVSVAFCQQQPQSESFVAQLYDGIARICRQHHVTLAGGDTNSWNAPFAISVTVVGEPISSTPILRCTARPGDRVFVTGSLGGSFASGHHLSFEPALNEIQWLLDHRVRPNALMDVSDGLAIDLHRLVEASGVGARLTANQIPISDRVSSELPFSQRLQHALEDGEDFGLLGTISRELLDRLNSRPSPPFKLTVIGEITEQAGIILVGADGPIPLREAGWQHL